MKNGVLLQKLQTLDKILGELRSLGELTVEKLQTDWLTLRAVERDLQIITEIVIDICQRILSINNQSPATTSGEAIGRCIELGALSDYEEYQKMVRFRNLVVHRYEQIDETILVDIVNNHLNDVERFGQEILAYANG